MVSGEVFVWGNETWVLWGAEFLHLSYQMALPGPCIYHGSWSWGKTEATLERWMSMANAL